MRFGQCLAVCVLSLSLVACGGKRAEKTPESEGTVAEEHVSITQESAEEIASRTRDVSVVASKDAAKVSFDGATKAMADRGFGEVEFVVEGCDGKADGEVAASGDSALEMCGWWVDEHERVWALHIVSGDVFASRLWADASADADMVVCEKDRVTMYNKDLGRLVRMGTDEMEAEGVQVVSVERLDAKSLSSVEVAS